jgi:hypothetical protein
MLATASATNKVTYVIATSIGTKKDASAPATALTINARKNNILILKLANVNVLLRTTRLLTLYTPTSAPKNAAGFAYHKRFLAPQTNSGMTPSAHASASQRHAAT